MEQTRADAWTLMTEYTASESLRRHMMAVEAAMRAYARQFDEDENARSLACCTTSTTSSIPIRRRNPIPLSIRCTVQPSFGRKGIRRM
jgi:hypothetical protein